MIFGEITKSWFHHEGNFTFNEYGTLTNRSDTETFSIVLQQVSLLYVGLKYNLLV